MGKESKVGIGVTEKSERFRRDAAVYSDAITNLLLGLPPTATRVHYRHFDLGIRTGVVSLSNPRGLDSLQSIRRKRKHDEYLQIHVGSRNGTGYESREMIATNTLEWFRLTTSEDSRITLVDWRNRFVLPDQVREATDKIYLELLKNIASALGIPPQTR